MGTARFYRSGLPLRAAVVIGLMLGAHQGNGAALERSPAPVAGTISTLAGGAGGPATATTVSGADFGVLFHQGILYVADGPAVREVSASDGLTTPAGTGESQGPSGAGGTAVNADL
jgi:hypothetical protein